jgi:hypothetical protein
MNNSGRYISSRDYLELKRLEKDKGLPQRLIAIFIKNQLAAISLELFIVIFVTSLIAATACGFLVSPFFPIFIQGICLGLVVLMWFLSK